MPAKLLNRRVWEIGHQSHKTRMLFAGDSRWVSTTMSHRQDITRFPLPAKEA